MQAELPQSLKDLVEDVARSNPGVFSTTFNPARTLCTLAAPTKDRLEGLFTKTGFRKQVSNSRDMILKKSLALLLQQYLRDTGLKHIHANRAFSIIRDVATISNDLMPLPHVNATWEDNYLGGGGFGDVRKGKMMEGVYALKTPRPVSNPEERRQSQKRFIRELLLQYQIQHPRVLSVEGVSILGDTIGMVTEYLRNGNLFDYLEKNPDTNRLLLLTQIASGLAHLHFGLGSIEIVHGDLKPGNVLIRDDGSACLADFGLSKLRNNGRTWTSSKLLFGSLRYMAGELVDQSNNSVTSQSDIYAFGMVVLAAITNHHPWPDCKDHQVVLHVLQGKIPERPTDEKSVGYGMSDELWLTLRRCWSSDPSHRPNAQRILENLRISSANYHAGRERVPPIHPTRHFSVSLPISQEPITKSTWRQTPNIQSLSPGSGADYDYRQIAVDLKESIGHVPIPGYLNARIIGPHGQHIKSLESEHLVKITLKDEVAHISGHEVGVQNATRDIREIVDSQQQKIYRVNSSVARKILNDRPNIIQTTRISQLSVSPMNFNQLQDILLQGTSEQIYKAGQMIEILIHEAENEVEIGLNLDPDHVGLIIGKDWQNWSGIVKDCDGPSDPSKQKALLHVDHTRSGYITLRGEPNLVNRLSNRVTQYIDEKARFILGVEIPENYLAHLMRRRQLREGIESRCQCAIWLPGSPKYDTLGDISALEKIGPPGKVVKVLGPRPNCYKAKDELTDLRTLCLSFSVKITYSSELENLLRDELRRLKYQYQMDYEIAGSSSRSTPSPTRARSLSTGLSVHYGWSISNRFEHNVPGNCHWTFWFENQGTRSEAKDVIHKLLVDSLQKVQSADHVGTLALPDRSVFARICGKNHVTRNEIQCRTGTMIHIPSVDSPVDEYITITGSLENVDKAKNEIIAIISSVEKLRSRFRQTSL